MCCILCCCCDSCNRFSSKCIELFIFITSVFSFGLTIIGFFYINKDNITLLCYIIFLALILFSFLILISIILILIWRFKEILTTKRAKAGEAFSIVGLVITIFYLICLVSLVSMIHTNYQEINHPCWDYEKGNHNHNPSSSDEEEFCIENPDYNTHRIPIIDYIKSYVFAVILGIFMLLLIYSWFNDYRRIKFLIEGSLNGFDAQAVKSGNNNRNNFENEDSNEKRVNDRINKRQNNQLNNKNLYKIYSQQENGIRYDIYGRPIIKINKPNNIERKPNIHGTDTLRYSKRKSILNNRVSIYKKRNSIVKLGGSNEVGHSSSSERNSMNKFQFSRNRRASLSKNKGTTSSNLN